MRGTRERGWNGKADREVPGRRRNHDGGTGGMVSDRERVGEFREDTDTGQLRKATKVDDALVPT